MRVYESDNVEETRRIAENLAKELLPGDVIAYRGGLGAGKTAFTRGLAAGLGIDCGEVSSPTFSLLNIYEGGDVTLYHFDMYRVTGYDSLYSTGFFDYLAPDGPGVLAIEWSENIADELPEGAIFITLTVTGEDGRKIQIEGGGRF